MLVLILNIIVWTFALLCLGWIARHYVQEFRAWLRETRDMKAKLNRLDELVGSPYTLRNMWDYMESTVWIDAGKKQNDTILDRLRKLERSCDALTGTITTTPVRAPRPKSARKRK